MAWVWSRGLLGTALLARRRLWRLSPGVQWVLAVLATEGVLTVGGLFLVFFDG